MKKLLPALLVFIFCVVSLVSPQFARAQVAMTTPSPVPTGGLWIVDPEVTFIGKNAARSGLLLDWALQNYDWVCVTKIANRQCDNSNNPLAQFWSRIVLYIVVPLLFVVILATAVVIIITRGKSLTIMRFIPRFIAVIILIVFSYSLLQFLYQFVDLIQGFFLRSNIKEVCPPNCISQKDLLYVGWDYRQFIGLRLLGDYNAESAFISLLLTKLTALTYFVMVGILLMRKIILWFFIIVSPIFPLLLLYYPVRNTGKIWIGEFFRWLLYAPLFAIFLNGLVFMWRQQIPLLFVPPGGPGVINNASQIIFPTAVNILLGGPKQFVTPTNSVNLTETFALYVVALIMLWIVILLPWILLQIFLDYASNFSPGESAVMKTLVNLAGNKGGGPGPGMAPGSASHPGSNTTVAVPFTKKFHIPTNLSPTGAAKEMMRESTTTGTSTSTTQPVSSPTSTTVSIPNNTTMSIPNNATVNAQITSLTGVTVPTMRDIAKYDTALQSNNVSKQQEVNQIRETLEKISNPVAVTSTVERDHISEIREKLVQESTQGNIVAQAVLNAANASSSSRSKTKVSNETMKNELQKMAKPDSVSNIVDRQKMTQMNAMITQESKGKNNQVATDILKVSDRTSSKEIESIKGRLEQAKASGDKMASGVIATVQTAARTENVKTALQQASTTTMHEQLTKASKEGSDLATSILSISSSTSSSEIEKLQERIAEAKLKGEPIATQLAALTAQTAGAPALNRVQTVSKADYQAVTDMWKENYNNLEVPDGMAGNRSEWIKDDIGKIDNIISLLSSADQDEVAKGMDEVSNILPFLLMGGFSQTEIIAYLQAKQEAAKQVSTALAADEESKVSVGTQAAHAEKTMAATMDTSSSDDSSSQFGTGDVSAPEPEPTVQSKVTTPISHEILTMANLKMPKMADIARYETGLLSRDESKSGEAKNVRAVLEKIANPEPIQTESEREQYKKLHDHLVEESKKGNLTANSILSAAKSIANKETSAPADVQSILAKMANPGSVTTESDKERFNKLHEDLSKASADGNSLAASILSIGEKTPAEDVSKLHDQLKEALGNNDSTASSVLTELATAQSLTSSSSAQTVSDEDYKEVQKLWEENYRTLPVIEGFSNDDKGRIDWIKSDVSHIQETIDLLQATDTEKRTEGIKKVAGILPFLLLGGFSSQEMVGYMKAKLEAGKTVTVALEKEEGSKVSVDVSNQQTEQSKEMAANVEGNKEEEKKENN